MFIYNEMEDKFSRNDIRHSYRFQSKNQDKYAMITFGTGISR